MDEDHPLAAARQLALNPAWARPARDAAGRPHCSVGAHLAARDDGLVQVAPLLGRVTRIADLPDATTAQTRPSAFESGANGRPMGSPGFLENLEAELGRPVRPGERGPKRRSER